MQGAQIRWNEAYLPYAAVTEDEAQRRRWTFCEVVIIDKHPLFAYNQRTATGKAASH